jgi:hypothetical protein
MALISFRVSLDLLHPPIAHGFSSTGSMSVERQGQTATRLRDGKVLVAGGQYGCCMEWTTLASAELYDPSTGRFSPTGSMTANRVFQFAMLLADGRVLMVGGTSGTTAEVYDPTTGRFSATGPRFATMCPSTATALEDGWVLITGWDCSESTSAISPLAELYDPTTGVSASTGAPLDDCVPSSATLLRDGDVLVLDCGSVAGGDNIASRLAELYDPATGTFRVTGAMTRARGGPTATLLADGRVLVTGGAANGDGDSTLSSAEIYDPASGTFRATGNMTTGRQGQTATLLRSGLVLVAGGSGDSNLGLDSAELFHPATGTFTPTLTTMVTGRTEDTATLLPDGRVLITGGGTDSGDQLSSAELYHP